MSIRNESPLPRLLISAAEAARALSVCEKTLWSYSRPRGSIPVVRVGKRALYDLRDLERWVDAQKERQQDPRR